MKIVIETIPHQDQRYPTCGDWFYGPDGTLHIKVTQLSDWRHEALIAVHELVEVLCCKHRGISQEQVDAFDMAYEAKRDNKLKDPEYPEEAKWILTAEEPGDHTDAPYRSEHCAATGVERMLAALMEVPWSLYENEILAQ